MSICMDEMPSCDSALVGAREAIETMDFRAYRWLDPSSVPPLV